jgi:hypothetical protein
MHDSIEQTNGQTQACIQRLRNLPPETMPPYNWQEFQRRSLRHSAAANDAMDWRPIAAAAAFLLFVCAIAIWGRVGGGGRHVVADSGAVEDGAATWMRDAEPSASYTDRVWQADTKGSGTPAGSARADDTAPRTRAIESWLATLPREPAVVRVGTRAAVAGLEDRIAQVDDLMTSIRIDGVQPDRVVALQRERLRLVGSLAQVRYAEVVASESP